MAASTQAQMCMIQPIVPKLTTQTTPAPTKNRSAARIRPWINCPKPGEKEAAEGGNHVSSRSTSRAHPDISLPEPVRCASDSRQWGDLLTR